MTIDIEHFGKWQREERLKQNISQRKLADEVGVSAYSIWAYENDMKHPTLFTMLCIAQYLGHDLQLNLSPIESVHYA